MAEIDMEQRLDSCRRAALRVGAWGIISKLRNDPSVTVSNTPLKNGRMKVVISGDEAVMNELVKYFIEVW